MEDSTSLLVVSPLALPDNAVSVSTELDGTEPKVIAARVLAARRKGWTRVAIAINTYYPKLQGGFYRNKALILCVQRAIAQTGMQVVQVELLSESGTVPNELEGALDHDEPYRLVNRGKVCGELIMWEYGAGGGSPFYRDAILIDANLERELASRLIDGVRRECQSVDVAFSA